MILSNDSFQEFHGQYTLALRRGSPHRRQAGARPRLGLPAPHPRPRPGQPPLGEGGPHGPAHRPSSQPDRGGPAAGAGATPRSGGRPSSSAAGGRSRSGRAPRPSARRRRAAAQPRSAPAGQAQRAAERPAARSSTSSAPIRSAPTVDGDRRSSFSSHGAYAMVGDVRCYVPLKAMGDPAPRRARDVLSHRRDADRSPSTSIDAPRRGIDLVASGRLAARRGSPDVVSLPTATRCSDRDGRACK